MNSFLNRSLISLKRSSTARSSAGRTVTQIHPADVTPTRPHAALAGHLYSSTVDAGEDFFRQIWTPGLLDRLQAPLTRYRE